MTWPDEAGVPSAVSAGWQIDKLYHMGHRLGLLDVETDEVIDLWQSWCVVHREVPLVKSIQEALAARARGEEWRPQ